MAVGKRRPKIINIGGQKGGIGKTLTSVNLAAWLAALGYETLYIDGDFQANGSAYLDIRVASVLSKRTLYDAILLNKPIEECILTTRFPKLDAIASSQYLKSWEKQGYKYNKIKNWMNSKALEKYDYIIVDTRPQPGSLFDNLFSIADWYLLPIFAESDAVTGLKIQLDELREIQEAYNPDLKCAGVLVTRFDRQNKTHEEYVQVIQSICANKNLPFLGTVPSSTAASSSVNRKTPFAFNPSHASLPVSQAYAKVAKELRKNLEFSKGRIQRIPEIKEQFAQEILIKFESMAAEPVLD